MQRSDTPDEPLIAYFAHDWGDAAISRRVAGFRRDGIAVAGFAMHRAEGCRPDWVVTDLGQTYDNKYLQRAFSIPRAARVAQGPTLEKSDLIVARNLDMLLVALAARRRARLRMPVIYECLDIHRLVARDDLIGSIFRQIERQALKRCAGFWVSSPAFLDKHFSRYYRHAPCGRLLENRLQAPPAPRPQQKPKANSSPKVRIGWFGNLRCARSLSLLCDVARRHADDVEVVLRGYPAEAEIPDFHRIVEKHPGLSFGGRYRWPEELASIYGSVDLVWAGDFMDAGKNSAWLLPNRLYEGGWYACPPIAPSASQTGKWVAAQNCGFPLDEPLEETLPALIGSLVADRKPIEQARDRLLALPVDTFIEPSGTLRDLVTQAIASGSGCRERRTSDCDANIEPSA
jgi:succinoglycan biosynthesis protein ExoL